MANIGNESFRNDAGNSLNENTSITEVTQTTQDILTNNTSSNNVETVDLENLDSSKKLTNQNRETISIEENLADPKVEELVKKYYPNSDKEDVEVLLSKMNKGEAGAVTAVLLGAISKNGNDSNYSSIDFFLYRDKEKTTGISDAEILKEYLADKGINVDVNDNEGSITQSTIEDACNKGNCQIVIDGNNFNLYSTTDLNSPIYEDINSHTMNVVGTTSDPNKILVSSWGLEFAMDLDKVTNYTIYNY